LNKAGKRQPSKMNWIDDILLAIHKVIIFLNILG